MTHKNEVGARDFHSSLPLKISLLNLDPEVMHVLPAKKVESFGGILISNCKFFRGPDHHCVALSVVVHHIFENRDQCLWIYPVEIDKIDVGDLDSLVALDEVDLASQVD